MNLITLPAKLTGETVEVSFDFASALGIGVTISAANVTAAVFSGEDATPSAIISGAASADGSIVTQMITAGTAGVVYTLNCNVTTSDSQEIILQARLAVISSNPF